MSLGTAGGWALGRLGLPEVGLEGGGGTEVEGVGRGSGGATRRDRSEKELRRSLISGPMTEFATWEPRSCILVWSSSTRRPIEFRAWIVEYRRGKRTDSPGERDWHSSGVSERSCWAERDTMRQVSSR